VSERLVCIREISVWMSRCLSDPAMCWAKDSVTFPESVSSVTSPVSVAFKGMPLVLID